jgi:sugar transferase (PEP-CTERM system associated)
MIGRFTKRTAGLILADVTIIYSGLIFALYIRLGGLGAIYQLNERNGWFKVSLVALICLIFLHFYDLYEYSIINNRRELVLRLTQALASSWVFLALIFYFVPTLQIGRGTSIYSVVVTLVLLLGLRSSIHFLLGHPEIGEKILIVGEGPIAIDTATAILKRRDAGYRIAGFVAEERLNDGEMQNKASNLGPIDDLEKIVADEKINRIVIAVRERRGAFPTEILLKMSLVGNVNIEECTSFLERMTGQVHLDTLRPSWLIFSGRRRDKTIETALRHVLHRSLALIGLIISLPIALITALLIRIESKGSIFYKQERVGKNGMIFNVIKFRSMREDAEIDGKPVWATANDDRVTRVGRIIRIIRVDEIPQFWNIIKGEMNFVGPRPERPHFVKQLAEEIPYYEHRHLTAPGLTGWAQVKYPYGASVNDAKQKLQYDLYYIKNQNLILDVIIVFETVKTVLFGRGAR